MPLGIVGKKCGMTRVFTEDGGSVPVTVVEVTPNRITRLKTVETDGYSAVQVTTGSRRAARLNQPARGEFAKVGVEAGEGLWEFRLDATELGDLTVGNEINIGMFEVGQKVDARGVTIGKGYAGGVKRHNFKTQDATHGNSLSHRALGSIGQAQTPGRVFKGKKMAGQMGNVNRTAQNLEVVSINTEKNYILIKGALPGPKGGELILKPATKARKTGS